jgi:hypothetical protein
VIPHENYICSNSLSSPFIILPHLNSNLTNINNLNITSHTSGYVREYKTYVATNTCFPHWKNEVKTNSKIK